MDREIAGPAVQRQLRPTGGVTPKMDGSSAVIL
jgi:hypothetical protein